MLKKETFHSLMQEGLAVLEQASEFSDARVDALRTVRYDCDSQGGMQLRDRWHQGVGVRVRSQGRWGFAVMEGDVLWKKVYERAYRAALLAAPAQSSPLANTERLRINDIPLDPYSVQNTEQLQKAVSLAHDSIPNADKVRLHATFTSGLRGVVNSEGTCSIRHIKSTSLSMSIYIRTSEDKIIPFPLAVGASTMRDLTSELLNQLEVVKNTAQRISSASTLEPGEYTVVLSPACTGYLIHEAFGHLCEADRIPVNQRKKFPLGMVVGSKELNICDRADVEKACGSMPFDDEGVPCGVSILVSEGRWVGLLHSRETAAMMGVPPTGNARVTSFRFPPLCRMRVTELCPGSAHPEEMISSVTNGLYLDHPYGGQIRGSQFHLSAMKVRHIRSGRLAESYAGCVLIAKPIDILRKIIAIGNDCQRIDGWGTCSRGRQKDLPVSMIAPTIQLHGVQVVPFL